MSATSPPRQCILREPPARSRHCTAPSYLTLPRHPGAGTVSGKVVAIDPLPTVLQSSHTPPRCIVTSTGGEILGKRTIFPLIVRTFLGYLKSRQIISAPCRITRLLFVLPFILILFHVVLPTCMLSFRTFACSAQSVVVWAGRACSLMPSRRSLAAHSRRFLSWRALASATRFSSLICRLSEDVCCLKRKSSTLSSGITVT